MPKLATNEQVRYLSSSDVGRTFLATLARRVEALAGERGLRILGPAGEGATSVALSAVDAQGRRFVLKLDPDEHRSAAAALSLAAWSRQGVAPTIHAEGPGWYLMDWVDGAAVPRPLTEMGRSGGPAVDALVTAWKTSVPDEALVDRFSWVIPLTEQRLAKSGHPDLPASLAERARALLPALRADQQLGACHGDPVGGNILIAGGHAFLIDPVPHADPFEALVAHWAVRARDGADTFALARFMTDRSGVPADTDSVRTWVAIHALTFAAYWLVTGRGVPVGALEYVRTLR